MRRAQRRLQLPLLSLTTLMAAVCLHELGHVLAVYMTGGRLLEIALFSGVPHVVVTNSASAMVEAFRAAAGSVATTGVFSSLLLFFGWRKSIVTETLALFCLIEVTGWVGSALTANEKANDAATFMRCTGLAGPDLAAICLCLAAPFVLAIALRSRAPHAHVAIPTPAQHASQVLTPLA